MYYTETRIDVVNHADKMHKWNRDYVGGLK